MIVTNNTKSLFILLIVSLITFSCANRGMGPQGGMKDVDPPVLERSVPALQQLNVRDRRIDLYFDEIVQLTDPSEKVVVSPAQIEPATIKAIGKRVSIVLNDTLKPGTTYTIDFGESLADNNEKNVLKNFVFSFSTGASIDTMQIAGTVLDARTLNPVPNVLVGIHSNFNDSVFTRKPLQRVGKTTDNGKFAVKGIRKGNYRVFALGDKNGNFFFDQPAEGIAVYPKTVQTSYEMAVRHDTIRTDSAKIDTIIPVKYVRYLPDTLVLRYFKEEFSRQRLVKSNRPTEDQMSLYFSAANDTLPVLKPLNFAWKQKPLLHHSLKNDTLTYWIRDTIASKMDSLKMALYYHKSDSAGKLVPAVDTLLFKFFHPKASVETKKKNAKESVHRVNAWRITSNISQDMDVDRKVNFSFQLPVIAVDSTKLHLYIKSDTLWKPVAAHLTRDDDVGLSYSISYPWKYDTHYKLVMDSALFINWKAQGSEAMKQEFKIRAYEDYSTIFVTLTSFTEHSILELLNANDQVLKTLKAKSGRNEFTNLLPGEYYIRLYVDANNNGQWDTGNFKKQLQPEQVYYYPAKIKLRANFDSDCDWNPTGFPLDKQKPKELIKIPEKSSGR